MATQKNIYYVGVLDLRGNMRYVTKITPGHEAKWEDGQPALKLAARYADEVANGLNCNCHRAIVIKATANIFLSNRAEDGDNWKDKVSEKCQKLLEDNEDNQRDDLAAGYDQGYYDGYYDGIHDGIVDVMNAIGLKHNETYYND